MLYCRSCHAPVEDPDTPACPACGAFLETTKKPPAEDGPNQLDDPERMVFLMACSGPAEAALLKLALESHGIETLTEEVHLLSSLEPLWGGGVDVVNVLIRAADAEAAHDLLLRKDAGELAITDEDVPTEDGPAGSDPPGGNDQ